MHEDHHIFAEDAVGRNGPTGIAEAGSALVFAGEALPVEDSAGFNVYFCAVLHLLQKEYDPRCGRKWFKSKGLCQGASM